MNKLLILALTMCMIVCSGADAYAKNENKENDDRVEVTLKDGTVIKGMVTSYWTKMRMKGFNQKVGVKSDDGRDWDLTAEDIDSLYFPLRPDDQVKTFVTSYVAMPSLRSKDKVTEIILGRFGRSEHAQVLGYSAWTDVHYGNKVRREMVINSCIKMDGDTIAYPYYYPYNGNFNTGVLKYHMKNLKKNPEWAEFFEAYFKDKAHKQLKKDLSKNPNLFLNVYEEFVNQSK